MTYPVRGDILKPWKGVVPVKQINLICSILALLCFVSMFMPIIAPRYPAGEYYAPAGNNDYYYTGEYYLAKTHWSVTEFASQSVVWRILLSLDQALLLIWALMSVRGEAGRMGLGVAVVNLILVGITVARMMAVMWNCRWVVLVVLALDCIAAVVMAAQAKGPIGKTAVDRSGKAR